MLQREILESLDKPSYERDQHLLGLSLTVERTDGFTDAFRDAYRRLRAGLLGIGNQVNARSKERTESVLGVPPVQFSGNQLIDAFQNVTIGYARTILREQILEARTLLDTPSLTLDKVRQREAILKTFDAYENRMRLVADNEVLRLNADLNRSRQTLAGIQQYVWTTCLDDRVRPRHQILEGTIQQWSHAPSPGYHPGEDFRCRCLAFPVLDDTYFLVRNQAFL